MDYLEKDMKKEKGFSNYLKPTEFLDFQSKEVQEFVGSCINQNGNKTDNIIKLYYKVRDTIRYDVSEFCFHPKYYKASSVIRKGSGYCIPKSILLAAVARAINIPSRICFTDVVNHIATEKFKEQMRSDVFVFHSYTDLFLNNKWVKATPAFNKSLCNLLEVSPLEFNGVDDSLFQEFDSKNRLFMEYRHFHGCYPDLPYDMMIEVLHEAYPHLVKISDIELLKNN